MVSDRESIRSIVILFGKISPAGRQVSLAPSSTVDQTVDVESVPTPSLWTLTLHPGLSDSITTTSPITNSVTIERQGSPYEWRFRLGFVTVLVLCVFESPPSEPGSVIHPDTPS